MKKIIFLLLIANTALAQKADSLKIFQKVTVGAVSSLASTTDFKTVEKPFNVGMNLSLNILMMTPKTYHSILYGTSNNSLNSLNGYFLKNGWDTYLFYSKSISTRGQYLGWGIERMTKVGDADKEGIKCFILAELGTDFKQGKYFTLGLLISVQHRVWKR
ncbi:MAG TPA: hypothetical protein VGE63_01695 [Candidatus Paceibacterota bacterium]